MADNKNKLKGDAATIQEQAKRIENLEQMLREESREHDKQSKYRKQLESELEAERNEKIKATKEVEALKATIQAERQGKATTAKEAAQAVEKIQAAQNEKEEWKRKAEEAIAKLQEEMNEREKLKQEAKLKLEAERADKEGLRKEAAELKSKLEAERVEKDRARQDVDAERAKNNRLRKEAAETQTGLENERKEKEEAQRKADQAIETERREKERLQNQVTDVNARLESAREEMEEIKKEAARLEATAEHERQEAERAQLENKELREREASRQLEEKRLNKVKWGPHKDREWTGEEVKRLRKFVLKSRKDSAGNAINLKILVFGPTGNGKSSLCNGFRSAIYGTEQPTTYYAVADGTESLTSGFQGAKYGDHWIIDMAGIFETRKIESSSIKDILSGKVPFYAEITDNLEVRDRGDMVLPPPGKNDVACVVLVMKYEIDLGTEVKRQIDTVIKLAGRGVVSFHLVITRLDECDPLFNDPQQLPHLYKSEKVQAAVRRISEETGIPPLSISFVKNYVRETETDSNTFILHLRVLEKIIFSAVDQVEKRLDQKRQREMYKVKYCSCMSCFLGFFLAVTIMSAVLIAYFWHQDFTSIRAQMKSMLSD